MWAVLAAGMMCEYLGWTSEAQAIESAVRAALGEGKTPIDLGGSMGTRELGDWLAQTVSKANLSRSA
jgi:isocitrate/isopropylmalate dehydrogenase